MNPRKWIIFLAAMLMILGTAMWIMRVKASMVIEAPGVRVVSAPSVGPDFKPARPQSVFLPTNVPGIKTTVQPITKEELDTLPSDTTFGRCKYDFTNEAQVLVSVVLMGTDRSSIHQPQYCLIAQGWKIDQTEEVQLKIGLPHPYILPAIKLTTSIQISRSNRPPVLLRGIYVYWFVSKKNLSANPGKRMWSQAKTWLASGSIERWAYASYFSPCEPGKENETFKRVSQLIADTVPQYQLTTGAPMR